MQLISLNCVTPLLCCWLGWEVFLFPQTHRALACIRSRLLGKGRSPPSLHSSPCYQIDLITIVISMYRPIIIN